VSQHQSTVTVPVHDYKPRGTTEANKEFLIARDHRSYKTERCRTACLPESRWRSSSDKAASRLTAAVDGRASCRELYGGLLDVARLRSN
jgi:hypothetical protein